MLVKFHALIYLKAAKASEEIENTVKHLTVLSVLGHEQLRYWPSTVAASLVIIVAIATKQNATYHRVMKSDDKCLAGICGALHCNVKMSSKSSKTRCNPAAAAKNRHLCESLANSYFPVNQGHQQVVFMNYFCANSVMLILVREDTTFP